MADVRTRDERAADVREETGASWRDIATLGQYGSAAEAREAVERVQTTRSQQTPLGDVG